MTIKNVSLIVLAALAFSGCATTPTDPIPLSPEAIGPGSGRIGVTMNAVPEVGTHLPGASCLLCIAAAAVANSGLRAHSGTLPQEDIPALRTIVADLLAAQGHDVVVIDEVLDLDGLPSFRNSSEEPGFARDDYRGLREELGVDKLLVLDITAMGFRRTYAAYVPTSDPKGWFAGTVYIVDLHTNRYDWYLPINIEKSAEGEWSEPPDYPGLTNAYFQALELAMDEILGPLRHQSPVTTPDAVDN